MLWLTARLVHEAGCFYLCENLQIHGAQFDAFADLMYNADVPEKEPPQVFYSV